MADIVIIPLANGETLSVPFLDLPEDSNEISSLLVDENSPLPTWHSVALGYYHRALKTQFVEVLQRAAEQAQLERHRASPNAALDIHTALGAHWLNQAYLCSDVQERDAALTAAQNHFKSADKYDVLLKKSSGAVGLVALWVAKALLDLMRGNPGEAEKKLESLPKEREDQRPVFLQLASGAVSFFKRDYLRALQIYRGVLRRCPACPPGVRVSIGLCQFFLGKLSKAREAFLRALQLDQCNVDALLAMAVVELNDGKVPIAMQWCVQAFELQPTAALALVHLSSHFFFAGRENESDTLARAAYHNARVASLRAEAAYLLGRQFHMKSDLPKALQFYTLATQLWPEYELAHFGAGQVNVALGQAGAAAHSFESVLKISPESPDALQALAIVLQDSNRERASVAAHKLVSLLPLSPASHALLAHLISVNEPVQGLASFETALSLHIKNRIPVPFQLWNNIGALKQRLGDMEGAREALTAALELLTPQDGARVTVLYNLCRVTEAIDPQTAQHDYTELLKEFPHYTDCYIRLGCLARSAGDVVKASEWFTAGVSSGSVSESEERERGESECVVDSLAFLASLHLLNSEYPEAEKLFKRMIVVAASGDKKEKKDAYGSLGIANIVHHGAPSAAANAELHYTQVRQSLELYKRVLLSHPHNTYAAHGIGIALADLGLFAQAKEIFYLVKEANGEQQSDVWMNVAHTHAALAEHTLAINHYRACNKKFFGNNNIGILKLIGNSFFQQHKYDDAIATLLKGLHIAPQDHQLSFNLALCLHDSATHTLSLPLASSADLMEASRRLELAEERFQFLGKLDSAEARNQGIDRVQASSRAKACASERENTAQNAISQALAREKTEADRLAEIKARLMQQQQEKERKEKEAHERLLEEKRKLQTTANEDKKNLLEKWESEKVDEVKKEQEKTTKRKRADTDADTDSQSDSEGQEKKKKKKKKSEDKRHREKKEEEKQQSQPQIQAAHTQAEEEEERAIISDDDDDLDLSQLLNFQESQPQTEQSQAASVSRKRKIDDDDDDNPADWLGPPQPDPSKRRRVEDEEEIGARESPKQQPQEQEPQQQPQEQEALLTQALFDGELESPVLPVLPVIDHDADADQVFSFTQPASQNFDEEFP